MAIENHLTAKEVAKLLNVNSSRVRQLYLEGRLQGEKHGTMLFFNREDVERFSQLDRPTGRPKQAN